LIFLFNKSDITPSSFFDGLFSNPLESIIYLIPSLFTSIFLIIIGVIIKNRINIFLTILFILILIFIDLFLTQKLYGSVNIDNYYLGYKGMLDLIYIIIIFVMYKYSTTSR